MTLLGTALHDTAQHGTALHDTAQHGTVCHGMAQHSAVLNSTARHGFECTAWHSMAQFRTEQHGMV